MPWKRLIWALETESPKAMSSDDGERPPDDAGQGQGGPQRLADEVAEEIAEEDARSFDLARRPLDDLVALP